MPRWQVLDCHELLNCSTGEKKEVADLHALKSTPCVPLGTSAKVAARVGRQPAHHDAVEPKPHECRRYRVKPLSELHIQDMPLSAMVAIQPGTVLWIFPNGCNHPERAYLVELAVGDILVWRGDLVHAGAGYAEEHFRIHAYIYPPRSIYHRPGHLSTSQCLSTMQALPPESGSTSDSYALPKGHKYVVDIGSEKCARCIALAERDGYGLVSWRWQEQGLVVLEAA